MITLIDHVGRTVIGKLVEETDTTIKINNPVIIHVTPDPASGRIQVQSFPYLFMEFIDRESRDKNNWTFYKSAVVVSEVTLDQAIINQYNTVNTPPTPSFPTDNTSAAEPEVIKLFPD